MKKNLKIMLLLLISFLLGFSNILNAQVKVLFDATKAETAGNADWVIDADVFDLGFNNGPAVVGQGNEANPQRIPTPLQSTVTATTVETYWKGGLSSWGIDCVKKGYTVETLPYNGIISYGNTSNAQDLSNYKIYVIVEPNILFTAAEKTAIMSFVQNGGSLFIVSDHTVSDRNNDGHDSPEILNDLINNNSIQNNPFGFTFDLANISGSSSNISGYSSDSLLHGSYGNVSQVLWSNGTTMTINPSVNPSVRAAVYKSGSSNTGNTNVLVAYARFGLGKVVAFGDSSPFDDGTGDTNDQLYDGYIADAAGNHQKLIMNATVWLATNTILPVEFTNFSCVKNNGINLIKWSTASEVNTAFFNVEVSTNGKSFTTVGKVLANGSSDYQFLDANRIIDISVASVYYRLEVVDKNGAKTYSNIIQLSLDNISNNHISFYPNPARETITIENKNFKEVSIIDYTGRIILKKLDKEMSTSSSKITINISSIKSGFYLLQAINKKGDLVTGKLFVE